jgi:hypothetical protein
MSDGDKKDIMMLNKILLGIGIIGFVIGICAKPFQYLMYDMEAPRLMWIIEVPALGITFGVIAAGIFSVILILLGGVIELLDKDAHWPHQ